MKRNALGKGLDALLPGRPTGTQPGLLRVNVSEIRPNPLQPRLQFTEDGLDQLAASILENGIIQPLILRKVDDHYQLVAGERRWRAAQKAGMKEVPAIIQQLGDQKMLEIALVENIQRQDLSAIEEAHAYQLLLDQFSLSQQEVAERVGRSRTAVTNTLRLLRLPKEIQGMILDGRLSMGHARALLPLPTRQAQLQLATEIQAKGLSVREVERRVQNFATRPSSKPAPRLDPNLERAVEKLEERCQTRIDIRQKGKGGRIVLHFSSPEELDRLYELLLGI